MTNVYVKIGLNLNDIEIISTAWTADTQSTMILDDDVLDVSKIQGYCGYVGEDGQQHLKFDQEKYDAYVEEVAKEEEERKQQELLNEAQNELLKLISVDYTESDKEGFKWKLIKIGDVVVSKVYVEEDKPLNDGSDYTKAITYKEGMSVEKGLWYTDGISTWECIKEGTPLSFNDKEYFDIVE